MQDLTVLNRLARTHSTQSSCEISQYSIVLRALTVLIRRGSNESCEISEYSIVLRELTVLHRPARIHISKSSCENSQYSFIGCQRSPARAHSTQSSCENSEYFIVTRVSLYAIVLRALTQLFLSRSSEYCRISLHSIVQQELTGLNRPARFTVRIFSNM